MKFHPKVLIQDNFVAHRSSVENYYRFTFKFSSSKVYQMKFYLKVSIKKSFCCTS